MATKRKQMEAKTMEDEEFSEDDENDSLYGGLHLEETKSWDVFRNPPPKNESGSMASQQCLKLTIKILKIVSYLFTFIIVLGSGVITKGTMLFMTSQLRTEKSITYCNKELGRDKAYEAILTDEERVAWMWCLMIAFAVPEVGSLLRSLRICFFKSSQRPNLFEFLIVFCMETLHTIGMAMLLFIVLPNLDVVKGAMLTNCVCFVPGVLMMLVRIARKSKPFSYKYIIDIMAVTAQASGFVLWPLLEGREKPELWFIPVTVLLVSCGWWENYISKENRVSSAKKTFNNSSDEVKKDNDTDAGKKKPQLSFMERLTETRYFTYCFVSIWKIICFFCCVVLIVFLNSNLINGSVENFFNLLPGAFGEHKITIRETAVIAGDIKEAIPNDVTEPVAAWENTVLYVLLIQVLAAYICYIFGKFACKILIQSFSYSFPVNLTIPVSISLLIAACGIRNGDPCAFHGTIPDYLFFQVPPYYSLWEFIKMEYVWVWLFWLLSQAWITIHIWTPKTERLASTEKLFVTPMYNAFLIDQSLGLNRRRDDSVIRKNKESNDTANENLPENVNKLVLTAGSNSSPRNGEEDLDDVTRIYACATMWHETKEEMMEMLKSIFRMDEDQCARRMAQKYLDVVDPDYYLFETHIFFDDAFEIDDDNKQEENIVNSYVKLLVDTIEDAGSLVHETNIIIRPPKKFPTPYGGRLEWTLPGKTKIIAHLKDKGKIRHKKRWSQVMYMYYLLGHRLMELPISVDRKAIRAHNTYILALDGDIDFQPQAVHLLIDLMKKNPNLGAACGRIHPIGAGPMVWYQKFEYAIGHWLQKATEHVIGCVLCSPGCFSLFRGKALMDDNVMAKYTTISEEARHYVQYDQGEDRWLCTLLLQRGYRVEYAAASDAYTHCPESFDEFYNQRRRWVPSTMANILDLLMDSRRTIKVNDNISHPYVWYQILIMVGTILGPGTIFLMLVGAFVAAFRIDNWTSFQYNIFPILIFMFVCFVCKSNIQLFTAKVISAIYGLVMMAVLVGIILQVQEDGILAPSSIFLFGVASIMVITGLLHPQELDCLPCGIIYYVTIPSMYLLLIIYSVFNLNNVSWGTRENPKKKKSKEELEEEKKQAEEAKKKPKQNSFFGLLHSGKDNNEEGSLEFSCAGLCKCMFCTYPKPIDEKQQLVKIAESLDTIGKRIDGLERGFDPTGQMSGRRRTTASQQNRVSRLSALAEDPGEEDPMLNGEDDDDEDDEDDDISLEPKHVRDDNVNPYWIDDRNLRKGEVDYISSAERQFWEELLNKYLHPLEKDEEKQAKVEKDLKDLRDTTVFAFFMLNALFVLVLLLLQLSKEQIFIKWPLETKTNLTYVEDTQEIVVSKEYLQLEPIGLVFVFFFALIMIVQFVAMLFHRFGTLSHILASTDINWYCDKKTDDMAQDAVIDKNFVKIVKDLQKLHGTNEDEYVDNDKVDRRPTIHNLEKGRRHTKTVGNLENSLKKRLFELRRDGGEAGQAFPRRTSLRRETLKAVDMRRRTIVAERRKSQMRFSRMASPSILINNNRGERPHSYDRFDGNGQENRAYNDTEGTTMGGSSVRVPAIGRPSVRFST